ncbi:MAG: hypothetical protein E7266_09190 [Lachnospiraceae bacterium]|nr:hypothetical protein [Lachnospiraceae bacterium]
MNYIKKIREFVSLKSEDAFYIGFILFFFSYWISQASESYPKYPVLVVAFCFFVYKNIKTSYTKKEIIVASLMVFMGVCTWISTENMSVFWCAMIITSMKNVSIKKVLKIMLYISMTITAVVMILALCGISGEVYKEYFGRVDTSEIRFHLGAKHPNSLHFRYMFAISLLFALLFERLKAYHFVILFGVNVILGKMTLSRTGFLCCTVIIILMAGCKYIPKVFESKWSFALINFACLCFIVVSLVGVIKYSENSEIWNSINKLASGRLQLGNQCFAMYGLTLFGSKVDEVIIFDMGIPRVLIENGVIVFTAMYVGMFATMVYFFKKKQYKYIIIMAVFILYSMSEKMNMYAYYNVQIVIMGFAMWQMFAGDKENKIIEL